MYVSNFATHLMYYTAYVTYYDSSIANIGANWLNFGPNWLKFVATLQVLEQPGLNLGKFIQHLPVSS
jgi:hypothetical protein